jgi:hypothetical protein
VFAGADAIPTDAGSARAVIDLWSRTGPLREAPSDSGHSSARTEFSATVFSGDLDHWVRYLSTPAAARYELGVGVRVHLHRELRLVAFEAEGEDAQWLAGLLDTLLGIVRARAQRKSNVSSLLDDLLFGNFRRVCPSPRPKAPRRAGLVRSAPRSRL